MTPNAAKLRAVCLNEENHPVLFISDPKNGDRFEFGTIEELANEAEAWEEEGNDEIEVGITGSHDLLRLLDFETYEGDQPTVIL